MILSRKFFLLPVLGLFILFPFYEGGETSTGLFVFHSITLISFAAAALVYSRFWIPRFLIFMIPFLLVLVVATWMSDYKYAAFLRLWDYFMGGIWTVLICTLFREHKEKFESAIPWMFCVSAVGSIIAILMHSKLGISRIRASFLNPNEYASFALMLLCMGIFCLEHEAFRRRKILFATLSLLILLTIGLSLSRGIFIASLAVALVAFLRRKPVRIIRTLLVLLILCTGTFVTLRLKYYEDPLQYYRWKIWKSSLKAVLEDPQLGTGLGMLEYRARTFNFPIDRELGRYSRIARSADNQYIQILAETGFLGFFSFLFGWCALFISLRKTSTRYFYLTLAWLIVTIASLFSVLLQNTSVLYLLLFLVTIPISESRQELLVLSFPSAGRILIPVVGFVLFVFGCYLPFQSHKEFYRALQSKTHKEADQHLANAVRYNPYQPYYKFAFIRKIVDARPDLETQHWLNLITLINQCIELNPLEFEFYLYKGRIFRNLLAKDANLPYYSSAVSSYQTALDYNPYNVFLRLEFASFLSQVERFNLAEAEVRTAIQHEPVFLNARLFLTDILISTNDNGARKEYAAFLDYQKRFGWQAKITRSPYIRSLLNVNEKNKQKVEESLSIR